jgi:hypothetical protein
MKRLLLYAEKVVRTEFITSVLIYIIIHKRVDNVISAL